VIDSQLKLLYQSAVQQFLRFNSVVLHKILTSFARRNIERFYMYICVINGVYIHAVFPRFVENNG